MLAFDQHEPKQLLTQESKRPPRGSCRLAGVAAFDANFVIRSADAMVEATHQGFESGVILALLKGSPLQSS